MYMYLLQNFEVASTMSIFIVNCVHGVMDMFAAFGCFRKRMRNNNVDERADL